MEIRGTFFREVLLIGVIETDEEKGSHGGQWCSSLLQCTFVTLDANALVC